MTIKAKLFGSGMFISFLLFVILALTIYTFNGLDAGFQQIVQQAVQGAQNSQDAESQVVESDKGLADVSAGIAVVSDSIQKTNMAMKILERKIRDISGTLTDLSETVEEIYEELPEGDTKDTVEDIASEVGDIQEIMKREALVSLASSVTLMNDSNQAIAHEVENLALSSMQLNAIKELSGELSSSNLEIKELSESFKGNISLNRNILTAILLALASVTLIMVVLFARSLSKSLTKAIGIASGIADGDLNQNVDINGKDEIGQLGKAMTRMIKSLKAKERLASAIANGDLSVESERLSDKDILGEALQEMVGNLRTVIQQVDQTANQVSADAAHISASSQSLSQNATESSAALQQISSSVAELSSQTKENAENASLAKELALSSRGTAETGSETMKSMVAAMGAINDSSASIAKIIKVIDEIAFQTNLLALNAAVEAARAGQHGKGFAVVAEEVRNLAGRSAKAAQETSALIEGSSKNVENGTKIAEQTAEAFAAILGGTTKVSDLVAEIATASTNQAEGITQVNQGLGQIDKVIQQNMSNAEETASTADILLSQASELQHLLGNFKLTDEIQEETFQAQEPLALTNAQVF